MLIRGFLTFFLVVAAINCPVSFGAATERPAAVESYKIQPGDILEISVWNEKSLQQDVLVRPDSGISFPLIGGINTQSRTIDDIQKELTQRLQKFIPDPSVSVGLKQLNGNKVYVLGKVNRPGEFLLSQDTDVVQALAKAGGMATFADANAIKILRRNSNKQVAIDFRYGDIERGKSLEQNILLQPGDVVVVP